MQRTDGELGALYANEPGTLEDGLRAIYNMGRADAESVLRDQFAQMAISALLTDAVLPTKKDRDEWLPRLAGVAYEVADAMLAARKEAPNGA